MQITKSRSFSDRSFVGVSTKTRAVPRVDMSSWRIPITARSVGLHNALESHVTVEPTKPALYLDDLSLPYADESLATTPADLPPSTSGRQISISGHLNWSANIMASFDIGSRVRTTPVSTVRTSGYRISISGHSVWSADEVTSTGTGSGGLATPTSDVAPPGGSPIDDESRDRCESIVPAMTSRLAAAAAGGSVDAPSTTGPSIPIYRPSAAAENLRRCEPTHFHWTSTSSSRPRPSLHPAIVDSIVVSSLVSSSVLYRFVCLRHR